MQLKGLPMIQIRYQTRCSLCLLLSLAGCEDSTSSSQPRCGYNNSSGFGGSTLGHAQSEGSGIVSYSMNSWNDTGQGSEYFYLLNCHSGLEVAVEFQFGFGLDVPGTTPPPPTQSLSSYVNDARMNNQISDFLSFLEGAENSGYEVSAWRIYDDGETGTCACDLYYPFIARNWIKRGVTGNERWADVTDLLSPVAE